MKALFLQANWIGGNLEGSVGNAENCAPNQSPCFNILPDSIVLLRQAGFRALSVENNHAADLGERGREATKNALMQHGILPLEQNNSPVFLRFGQTTIGFVALSVIARLDGHQAKIPSVEVGQRIRLARQLSNLVVISIHWGSELLNWPTVEQRNQAKWLVAQGADIVIGHHPHVIQPLEAISGKPVYFSLGNHLFDQKYPETKEGLIADIRISGSKVLCGGIVTHTSMRSSVPGLANNSGAKLRAYELSMSNLPEIGGFILRPRPSELSQNTGLVIEGLRDERVKWISRPAPVVSLEAGRLGGPETPELLLSLQLQQSPIDGERGLRPYVYEIGSNGLIAKWRGSALAWPLIDATLLSGNKPVLCALHRGDSFIMLDSKTKNTRIAAYQWNGFGFTGIDDSETIENCRSLFDQR